MKILFGLYFEIVICGLCQFVDTRAVYSNSNLKPSGNLKNLVDEFRQKEIAQYPDYEYSNKNEDKYVHKTQDKTSKDFLYKKRNCHDGENCSEEKNLRQSIPGTNDDELGSSTENSFKNIDNIVNNKDVSETVARNLEDKFVDMIGIKNDEKDITNVESKEKNQYYTKHVNRVRTSEQNKDEISKNTENNNNEEKNYYNIGIKRITINDEYENFFNEKSSNVRQDKEKVSTKNNFQYSDKSSQNFDTRNYRSYGGSLENQYENWVKDEENDYDEGKIHYIPDNIERRYPIDENAVIQNEIVGRILDTEADEYQDISDEVEKTKAKYGFRIQSKIRDFENNRNVLNNDEIVQRRGNTKKFSGDKDTMALRDREVINNNTNGTYDFIKRVRSSYSDIQDENAYLDLNNMLKNKNLYGDYNALKGEVDAIDNDYSNESAFDKEKFKTEKAEKLLKKLKKENKSRSKLHKPQTNKKVKVYKKHLKIRIQNRMGKTTDSSSCSKKSGERASKSAKFSKYNKEESEASSGCEESSEKASESTKDGEQESGASSAIEDASESSENSEEENKHTSHCEETSESPEYSEEESEASSGSKACSEDASELEGDGEEESEELPSSEESSESSEDSEEASESSSSSEECNEETSESPEDDEGYSGESPSSEANSEKEGESSEDSEEASESSSSSEEASESSSSSEECNEETSESPEDDEGDSEESPSSEENSEKESESSDDSEEESSEENSEKGGESSDDSEEKSSEEPEASELLEYTDEEGDAASGSEEASESAIPLRFDPEKNHHRSDVDSQKYNHLPADAQENSERTSKAAGNKTNFTRDSIPNDIGNFFVYVDCKSCKIKSELEVKGNMTTDTPSKEAAHTGNKY